MEEKRKRGRPKTVEREQTIRIAMENYWKEGVEALSINEICRRTNLSKPSLYREFGGEDGLHDAALDCYIAAVYLPMVGGIDNSGTFMQALDSLLDNLTCPKDTPRGCLLVKMRDSPHSLGPKTKARLEDVNSRMRQGFLRMFQHAQSKGEAREDIDPGLAAGYLDTQVTSVLRQLGFGGDPNVLKAEARLAFSALLTD